MAQKRKVSYKPFKEKFVVCERDDDGNGSIALFTEDNKRNRVPVFLDTPGDAMIEIGDFFIEMGKAYNNKDISIESLNEPFTRFIAKASLTKECHLYVWTDADGETSYEDQVIYDDHIINLIN
jgi:hypothetical protein